jgi:uncharacterized protein
MFAGKSVACPCCNGALTPSMLQKIIDDASRLEGFKKEFRAIPTGGLGMMIDPHAHMTARTTDDYEAMAQAGIVAVIEPAFWLGQLRTHVGTFVDYFSTITGFERVLPRYLTKEGVVAVGEIGYDEQTPQEDKVLRAQIEMAKEYELPIMIHTPHRDKTRGTQRTMDVLEEHGFDPSRCVIDHNNEETVREVLDRGYWCAFTIYPSTKMGNERLAALVQQYGSERVIVDSSCDWGVSDPLAVPKTARLMADKGISADIIHQVVYKNALAIYGLNGEMKEEHWLTPQAIDQRTLYDGNSVLRGQEPKVQTQQADANVIR